MSIRLYVCYHKANTIVIIAVKRNNILLPNAFFLCNCVCVYFFCLFICFFFCCCRFFVFCYKRAINYLLHVLLFLLSQKVLLEYLENLIQKGF